MNEIKELFAKNKRRRLHLGSSGPTSDGRIKAFESNGAMARSFFKNLRVGMQAGNKDVKAVGDHHKEKEELSDLPRFTPFNCNFFKVTLSSKSQEKLMSKDRDRSNEARLTSDKIHPIYDTKNYKQYINSEKDRKFMLQY